MNNFTYKILSFSNHKIKKQIFNKHYNIDNYIISLNFYEKSYSDNLIKEFDFHAILLNYEEYKKYDIKKIQMFAPHIEIYIITDKKIRRRNVYTIKKIDEVVKILYKNRLYTPFMNILKSKEKVLRFCSPGHGGKTEKNDISISCKDVGSLLMHTGAFAELESKISRIYNTKYSFISIHGSSTSNKILLSTLLNKNDKVIIDRNIHKSVIHSVIISGALPVFVQGNFMSNYNILLPGNEKDIINTIEKNKDAKLLIITSPSYEGAVLNLKKIIKIAHKNDIKIYVDEAWGSHLSFNSEFPKSALEQGADYVVHSLHKTLNALSLASVMHINDNDFEKIKNDFFENYLLFSSTSPLYIIVSSIDAAITEIAIKGKIKLNKIRKLYEYAKKQFENQKGFNILENDIDKTYYNIDYSRLTISFFNKIINIKELEKELFDENIVIEKINDKSFTILLQENIKKIDIDKFIKSFNRIKSENINNICNFNFSNINIEKNPHICYFNKGKWIDIKKSEGKISAILVVPYPPGIPLLIPGQRIEKNMIKNILKYEKNNMVEIHGLINGKIKVVENDKQEK